MSLHATKIQQGHGVTVWYAAQRHLQDTGAHPPAHPPSPHPAADSSHLSPFQESKGATSYSLQPLPGKSASNEWSEKEHKGPSKSIRKFLKAIPGQSSWQVISVRTTPSAKPCFSHSVRHFSVLFCLFPEGSY